MWLLSSGGGFTWNALITGPIGRNAQGFAEATFGDLRNLPRRAWDDTLEGVAARQGVRIAIYGDGLRLLAGDVGELPPLFAERIQSGRRPPPPGRAFEDGPAFDKFDEHATHTIAARLSEEALTEFLDRLDAHDLGAEIYVPVEFEGRVTVGDFRVASSQALLDVLEEMREELSVDAEEDDEDEEEEDEGDDDEGTVIEAQLRHIWHLVADGATESIEKGLPLHIQL